MTKREKQKKKTPTEMGKQMTFTLASMATSIMICKRRPYPILPNENENIFSVTTPTQRRVLLRLRMVNNSISFYKQSRVEENCTGNVSQEDRFNGIAIKRVWNVDGGETHTKKELHMLSCNTKVNKNQVLAICLYSLCCGFSSRFACMQQQNCIAMHFKMHKHVCD